LIGGRYETEKTLLSAGDSAGQEEEEEEHDYEKSVSGV
jgi:hypothetical protein